MQSAQALGANAIIGIDIDYETVGANGSMLMVATSGTAVVISNIVLSKFYPSSTQGLPKVYPRCSQAQKACIYLGST